MPVRDTAPLGAPCWIDLTTSDVEGAQDFYGTVFGWTFESAGAEYGGYINAARNGHPVAGLMANNPQWQPLDHRGFEVIGEDGAPVWHQLTTHDYRAAIDFYREVLGWRTQQVGDTDEFRYTTALFDGQQLLGVMDGSGFLPEGVPSNWTVFFGAEDVDKTLEVIADNGGAVLRQAEDTPYGRLAAATDPTGVVFKLSSL